MQGSDDFPFADPLTAADNPAVKGVSVDPLLPIRQGQIPEAADRGPFCLDFRPEFCQSSHQSRQPFAYGRRRRQSRGLDAAGINPAPDLGGAANDKISIGWNCP